MGNKENKINRSKRLYSKKKKEIMKMNRIKQGLASNISTNQATKNHDENVSSEEPVMAPLENVGIRKTLFANTSDSSAPKRFEHMDAVGILKEVDTNNEDKRTAESGIEPRVYKSGKKVTKKKRNQKSKSQSEKVYNASERLIIDKIYFFEKLKIISNHAPQFGCNLNNINITGETKIGLYSKLKLCCNMCNAEFVINTSDPHPTENLDINTAAVTGITNAGIGLEQFQGLCTAINLPIMTQHMFNKKHVDICDQWDKTAQETMATAAERERIAAIEEGRVKDGVAVIDVIADACWSKRSYKSNYAAFSGAAAIIGKKFGEVLFLGVKNKYCCICARAHNRGIVPKEHKCFKNYTGPSTGMEAEIICEGFKNSISMYNLIYGRVIADGDSSTYAKILEERPYKNFTVEKIECRNHILRNMCNKLVALSKETKYPLSLRKMLTTQRILAIRKAICAVIRKHKNDDSELQIRINRLYKDISNSYNHAFGHHDNCLDYYCSSSKTSEDLVLKIKNSMFWSRIQYVVGLVASHSRSLINDFDNNAVEQFNSIIAKFVGGKRTNLIQRQTYQSRCAAAVVSYNTKKPLFHIQKALLGKSPISKTKKFEDRRAKRNTLRKKRQTRRKLFFDKKKIITEAAAADKNYGTDTCNKPDMKEDVYEMAKNSFLKNLEKTDTERSQVERSTILQRDSSEWLELRRNLLTASNFGKIIKRRDTTSASIVKTLLYKSDLSHVDSIKHGIVNEKNALNQLAVEQNVQINPCGLFIDKDIPFLAATPDGLVGDDTIVEVKCPLSALNIPIKEAVEKKKIKFWKIKDEELVVNKNDSWYYQVQGQLHVTNRNVCLFAVWSGECQKLTIEKILRDDDFWKNKMVNKLIEFYMKHLLPEILDPRKSRNMPLRQTLTLKKRKRELKDEPVEAGPSKKPTVVTSHLLSNPS